MRHIEGLLILVLFGACATSGPKPIYPSFKTADQDVFGGWIEILPVEPKASPIAGELIGVDPDRVVVLTPSGAVQVEKQNVKQATLTLYEPKSLLPNVGTGMLLSISNGVWASITMPLWGLAGGKALRDVNVAAEIEYPRSTWDELRKGARFPQGLPEGLDILKLSPRMPSASPKARR